MLSFNITAGKPVGLALVPSELKERGELAVLTTNRLTKTFHSGAMTRNLPLLSQLVPELFAYIPEPLESKLGIKPGDYVEIATARGTIRLKAFVTKGEAVVRVNNRDLPVVNLIRAFSFQGRTTGPQANFLNPDVGDVVTTIQESKAWIGFVRRAG